MTEMASSRSAGWMKAGYKRLRVGGTSMVPRKNSGKCSQRLEIYSNFLIFVYLTISYNACLFF